MTDREHLRVSDHDRQAAVERLRIAMGEGRLDLLEYDDRLAQAYRSVTYGDLDRLFVDLPAPGSPAAHERGAVAPRKAAVAAVRSGVLPEVRHMPLALKILWTIWVGVMLINLTVWLLVSVSGGGLDYFWPMWLLVPGAALFGVTVGIRAFRRPPGPGRRLPPAS